MSGKRFEYQCRIMIKGEMAFFSETASVDVEVSNMWMKMCLSFHN